MFSICFRPVASLGCVAVARKIFVPVAVSRFRQIALLGCGKISAVENHFNKSAEEASSGSKHVAHSAFDFIFPQKMVFYLKNILNEFLKVPFFQLSEQMTFQFEMC